MKYIIIVIISVLLTIGYCNHKTGVNMKKLESFIEKELKPTVTIELEKAYYEGQRDFQNGDIKISNENCPKWIKSPWDNNKTTTYIPCK